MFILKDGQKVGGVRVDPASITDAEGNPASIDPASVTWRSSDESLVTVAADPNDSTGETQIITTTPGPGLGDAIVTATADADLGEGVKSIEFAEVIRVVAGDAAAGTIAITGTPEDRDAPTP